jgi:hypothetical protein
MKCNFIPIQLSDEQKGQISGILSVGCDLHTAANFAGCSLADIRSAIQCDAQFAASVRRSEAGAEVSCMRTVQQAAKDVKNWRAATWWLERHAPERFGPRRAGAVTARQLKAYIAILAGIFHGDDTTALTAAQIRQRLFAFGDSVDQLLRNERMLEPDAINGSSPGLAEGAESEWPCEESSDSADEFST